MRFYPDDAAVPAGLRTEHLRLEPLTPAHVAIDYDAFMSSRPRLMVWSGGSWPDADFTIERNMEDMHFHDGEHQRREAFTYTVLDHAGMQCQGCVYINPWEHLVGHEHPERIPAGAHDFDAIVSYWVRDSALALDRDRELLAGLLAWFPAKWAFSRALFMASPDMTHDIALYGEAGLARLFSVDSPRRNQTLLLYGRTQ